MQVQNFGPLGFLAAWLCFVVSNPTKTTEQKETYHVCEKPVCIQRARLITESLNKSVDPCTDFYSYACGGWMSKHKIPKSQPMTGSLKILKEELKETLRDILGKMTLVGENQNATDKAALVYNACLAVPDLADRRDVILAIMNTSGLAQWPKTRRDKDLKRNAPNSTEVLIKTKITTIFSIRVSRDFRNLGAYAIQLDQLEFPTVGRKQLIRQNTPYSKPIIAAYKRVIQVAMKFMKRHLSDGELEELSNNLLAFERKLATMTLPAEESRDLSKLYHRTTIEKLEKKFSHIPIHGLLQKQFSLANITLARNETVELFALGYYKKLNEFLRCADPDTLFNYAGLRHILNWATTGSQEIRSALFELRKVKVGVRERTPRWELCVSEVNDAMAESVGYLYVQHKFSQEAKKEVEDLVSRIKDAFNESLQSLQWLDEISKAAAEMKLKKMGMKIGYPDWLLNTTYIEGLYKFVPNLPLNASYGEMMYAISLNKWKQEMLKLRQAYDKEAEWLEGAAVVNAFYNPSANEMVFPSGILQGVLYEHGLPRSMNFGAIGIVVGHEMTHGFDDTGGQFNAEGALKQWWTKDTRTEFMKRAKCFQYEYGNITDMEARMRLNGRNTVGENIADNGGVRLAFEAYKKLLEEECGNVDTRLKGLEAVTGKQLFFIATGMVWCSLSRPEFLMLRILYNSHSPARYRVNVPLSNMADFSDTFNCPVNSPMNRKHRCKLW
ncbi:neprilysin-1-like [Dermacentor andersoni]|uniref:neprilysin-1-like n=1 Tax=Dermacentor andersoni TaxID=34620 RepID=UPI0021559EA5|nr:neprilysin-4-like [Dermacentor andersoni]XP_050041866.1 neprilysin-4-like [Dermacentor andersoni]